MLPANSPAFCQVARWRAAADPSGPDAKILASSMSSANNSTSKNEQDPDDPFGIKALEKAGIILKEARSTASRPDSTISTDSTRTSTKASTWPFMSGESRNMSSSSSFTSQSSSRSTGKTSKFKEIFDWNNDTPIDMSSMPGYPSLDECWVQDQKAYDIFKRQHAASVCREEHYRASETFKEPSVSDHESQSGDTRASEALDTTSTYSDSVYDESGSKNSTSVEVMDSVQQAPSPEAIDTPSVSDYGCEPEDVKSASRHDSLLPPFATKNPLGDIWASLEAPVEATTFLSKECRVLTPPSTKRVVSGMGYRASGPLEPFPAFDVTEMAETASLPPRKGNEVGAGKKSKKGWRGLVKNAIKKKCTPSYFLD
ncbi:hypothetical protein HII31_06000 [Pseudocercospora fuligena]|uniref:Uncharacterized protein n=1 Tax=Pseudocercospora fuligena TaxID=685502 RepID=A0A8H6RKD4_9PEZI|nr:hypothetical protein HII31_06000 [Pseudocercospora fuligena]